MVIMGSELKFLMFYAVLLVGSSTCNSTTPDQVSAEDSKTTLAFNASVNVATTTTVHPELSQAVQTTSKWSGNKVEAIMNKIAHGELERKDVLAKSTKPQNTSEHMQILRKKLDHLRNHTSYGRQRTMPWVDLNLTAYFSRLMWETAARIIQKYSNGRRALGRYVNKMRMHPGSNTTGDTAQSMWDEFVSLFDWSEPSPTYPTTTTKKLPKWKRRYDYEFPWQRPTFLPGEAPFPPGWEPAESQSAEHVFDSQKENDSLLHSPDVPKNYSDSINTESTEPMSEDERKTKIDSVN